MARAVLPQRPSTCAPLAVLTAATLALLAFSPRQAHAQSVKPRFIFLVDSSGSMTEDVTPLRVETHGDGSQNHPGCDIDNNGRYDDSKLFQAKAALNETIAAFGSVEFSLAKYRQNELGQPCTNVASCPAGSGANACVAGRCAFVPPNESPDYDECQSGSPNPGNGCVRCASPANDPTHIYYNGNVCCGAGGPRTGPFGIAGDVLVPFPPAGGRNTSALLSWIDGEETFPIGDNREIRGSGVTPIGGSLNAVRDWLTNDASAVGPEPGIVNRDPQIDCRSYNVILITDGLETGSCTNNCGLNGARAAENLYRACTNGGIYDPIDDRCERAGNPAGTREIRIKTYVVGYTVNDPSLNSIAAAGGTGTALLANNGAELTARLGDIVASSIPVERCDCQDNTCDGAIDEAFPTKGSECYVGVGRCRRKGVHGCRADGTGVVCTAGPAGMCPATPLGEGTAVTEQCGAAPGCLAPNPEDCADDDCDGLVDENISCACTARPEICNGVDDDCNGTTDDVPVVACGLDVGECRPGTTACVADGQGGKRTICVGATERTAELCDGKDNDCDGVTDGFGLPCFPAGVPGCTRAAAVPVCGEAGATWTCQGICAAGVLACTDGQCGACLGAITPQTELACDGLDNDCDGATDEGFGLGEACGPGISGKGECKPGVFVCAGTTLQCMGGQGPTDEVCNGKDDDCDGITDNLPGTCGIARGACVPGRFVCVNGQPVCEQLKGPRDEVCNGKDDDCDGTTDEEPTDPELTTPTACGSDEGICRPGVWKCLGGRKVCDGGAEAGRESCNALDDDCDGSTDEGLNSPGPCPPPGLPPGSVVRGECRPGANACTPDGMGGAMWTCQGGTGPAAELCDGKDNDCDGAIDDDATCPEGFGCAFGECVPRCIGGEFECGEQRLCVDGLCVQDECVRTPCPRGFSCDGRRGCVSRCEGVKCPFGLTCDNGECTSCFLTGCAAGQICRGLLCEPDPCANVSCGTGTYCRKGTCTPSCNNVTCKAGETCRLGACVPDKCSDKVCKRAEYCEPSTGACASDPCILIQCLAGQVCVPSLAMCVPDPCLATQCKGDDACVVRPDGEPECVQRSSLGGPPSRRVTVGGTGCSCTIGAADAPREGQALAFALVVTGTLLGWRRRRGGRR